MHSKLSKLLPREIKEHSDFTTDFSDLLRFYEDDLGNTANFEQEFSE